VHQHHLAHQRAATDRGELATEIPGLDRDGEQPAQRQWQHQHLQQLVETIVGMNALAQAMAGPVRPPSARTRRARRSGFDILLMMSPERPGGVRHLWGTKQNARQAGRFG
jgi:hypothetical protein